MVKKSSRHSTEMQRRRGLNKKAQLSLGKTRYSLYSSCCSRPTDFQGHPRSM